MELWRPIVSFPGYLVSDEGRVYSEESKRPLAILRNQQGYLHIGLTRDGVQYKRSITPLVAQAFVVRPPRHKPEFFNTPINLDGDKSNNFASNLAWRPRWFAVKYSVQFSHDRRGFTGPVVDTDTGLEFATSWDAARHYGLLEIDILQAMDNRTYVWPLYKVFHRLQTDIK